MAVLCHRVLSGRPMDLGEPRRFAVITNHQHNEKLNHFYVDRVHEHNILANRTPCWPFTEMTNSSGKVTDKTIASTENPAVSSAGHETFKTGFEHKSAMKLMPRKERIFMARESTLTPRDKLLHNSLTRLGITVRVICRNSMRLSLISLRPNRLNANTYNQQSHNVRKFRLTTTSRDARERQSYALGSEPKRRCR